MRACLALLILAATATATAPLHAAPFVPKSDGEVVEKLPANTDPAVRGVESLRRQLAANPGDAPLRISLARRYFDLAMAQGDPRYVGYAFAALAPLEKAPPASADYWLARGLLLQYSHDFEGALRALAWAVELDPRAVEPVTWRAAIRMVQARYADAEAECRRLTPIAEVLLARGCAAYAQAATGQLQPAYEGLRSVLAFEPGVQEGLKLWVQTRLAEMAMRLQRWDEAERLFKDAMALGITDQFLLGAYADFLLLRKRPAEAVALLEGWERSDVLLLRLALGGKASGDRRAAGWAKQLRERFDAAGQRGDRLHEQEAARFALDIENKPAEALALAKRNYEVQKEPRDAEILMRAALAAKQPDAARPALDWLKQSGYQDPRLEQLARELR